jgi:hypothetical protein
MGIYSDGKVYGIYIKPLEIKITSSDPLTNQQIQIFLNTYNRISETEKSEASVYFLESISTTYCNITNKTYNWVLRSNDALSELV